MILPNITNKQKQILFLLYQFRFLNTHQLQKILNHKNPKRVQTWLKDLKDKKYINTNYSPKTYIENTKPATYYLASQARHILKENKNCDLSVLSRIYKEKSRTNKFISQCLAIAGIYAFFLTQKDKSDEINFFTESDLVRFDYFPDSLPSAYISVKAQTESKRYFLDYFDENTPSFVLRNRIKQYLQYYEDGKWQENSNNSPFPSVLIVCPNERTKKHIYYYAKAVLDKTFNDDVTFFLTKYENLKSNTIKKEIWQKVNILEE